MASALSFYSDGDDYQTKIDKNIYSEAECKNHPKIYVCFGIVCLS